MSVFADVLASIAAVFATLVALLGGHEIVAQRTVMPEPPRAEILFGGDMMFDRSIRVASDREGQDFILSCLKPILEEVDLVVANLEGPITGEPSVSTASKVGDSNNFTFTFPLSTAELLARHNMRIVNLGNNHILNFGTAGEGETVKALESAGVGYFGDTATQRMATTSVGGVRIAFINYNQFSNTSTRDLTVEQIGEAQRDGYVPIVYTHWGDEYVEANDVQKRLARAFVDAGAEMVIGTHPHVMQEHEIYHDKHIYYSLGNLIFDQYWNDAVRRGLLISVTLTQDGVQAVRETETMLERDRRTCPVR